MATKRDCYENLGVPKTASANGTKSTLAIDENSLSCYVVLTAPRYGSPSRGSFIGAII
jgi:hypothetical protein